MNMKLKSNYLPKDKSCGFSMVSFSFEVHPHYTICIISDIGSESNIFFAFQRAVYDKKMSYITGSDSRSNLKY